MALAPAAPEVVTQESLLLQTAERIGRIREGRTAVHIHLSQLRPQNRQEGHLRIALRIFDPMVNFYRGQIFLLTNSDIVMLVKDARPHDIDALVSKLRGLFSEDPLTRDDGDGRDRFATIYELDWNYPDFLVLCQKLEAEVRQKNRDKAATARAVLPPMSAKGLGAALERMGSIDVSGLVRRQSAIIFAEKAADVIFQEFFVSMADLQNAVSPDMNMLGNRWLFQHLSAVLDQRMLGVLQDMGLRELPKTFSLNLNVSTVHTDGFKKFAQWAESQGRSIVVELQIIDVFNDLSAYFAAHEWLRARGHKVLLDSLSHLTLSSTDIGLYDADYFKLNWSPEFTEADFADRLRVNLDDIGVERAVLMRCDSEAAIQFGMNLGITSFQGRYVDAMLSAVTMALCDKSSACTLQQCVARRGVISGRLRGECGNWDRLDGFPPVRVPGRKKS